jgi:hypothetical protein
MANGIRDELSNNSSRNVRIAGTSVVRFADSMICLSTNPSTKVLGYFHVVRFADVNRSTFGQSYRERFCNVATGDQSADRSAHSKNRLSRILIDIDLARHLIFSRSHDN